MTNPKTSHLGDSSDDCELWHFHADSGEVDEGFIAWHHTVPVSLLQPGQTTTVSELALLCANCNWMIPRSRRVVTVQDLRCNRRSAIAERGISRRGRGAGSTGVIC
jgi:predicted HNH restriction endonuclease